MRPNPVGWFEIYVKDMQRARTFYQKVFQTELSLLVSDDEMEMFAFPMEMNAAGASGALCRMSGFNPGGNSVLVYFTSEDCAVEEKRIVAAGGKVQKPKTSIGQYGFISLGVDSEGNMFGIHSQK